MTDTGPRIFIIGAGYIARQHAAAIALLPDPDTVELAVADPSAAVREGFLAEFPKACVVADAAELLDEPARPTDIVIVATPPFTHRDLAIRALGSGRHVLCEKPLAMGADEARAMLAAARAADRLLGCCSSRFLGLGPTAAARAAVESGALGELYHATFTHRRRRGRSGIEYQPTSTWFLDRSRSGGGVLMDWGCYDLTTLFHVLGPIAVTVRSAWMVSPETALDLPPGTVFDTDQHVGASLVLTRADGQRVRVTYERSACTHGAERDIAEIEGMTGAVRWDWVDWVGDGRVTITTDDHGQPSEATSQPVAEVPAHAHWRPLVQFAAQLRGEASDAVVDERAVFNFLTLRAISDSARTGQPQTVTLEDVAG